MDLTNGWEFSKDDHRARASKKIQEEPYCTIGSPPCTMFSLLQELAKAVKGIDKEWLDKHNGKLEETTNHTECYCLLYRYQLQRGRHFLYECPWSARSWVLESIQKL